MFDTHKSKIIFDELMNGRVINKRDYNQDGSPQDNPLFDEIISNEDSYRTQYLMNGYQLVMEVDHCFIRDNQADTEITDLEKRISVLFLIISRYITKNGYRFEMLKDPNHGLTEDLIQEIDEEETTKELKLKVATDFCKQNLKTAIDKNLYERNLMARSKVGRYFLTDSGVAFFDNLFNHDTN